MYIDGFSNREDIENQFEAQGALEGAILLYAKYKSESYEGSAYVLFEKDGKLYEVHGSHCSCNGLEGQWGPEETSFQDLNFRWFSQGNTPYACDSEEEVIELKRIVLGELFEKAVLN